MNSVGEIAAVILAVVVFLAFMAYSDKQDDLDQDERKRNRDDDL